MEKRRKNILTLAFVIVFQFILLYCVVLFNDNLLMDFPLGVRMVLGFVTNWIMLIVPVLLMINKKERLSSFGFSNVKIPAQVFIGIAIGIVMCLVLTVVPILCGLKDMVSDKRYTKTWQFIYEFFFAIFGVALWEEFFFRGYVFKKLMDIKESKLLVIIVSSIVFGLLHIFGGDILQVFVSTAIGIFLCVVREKIKGCSTLSLILAHGIHNTLIVLCVAIL